MESQLMEKLNRISTTLTPDIAKKETTGSCFSREQKSIKDYELSVG
jgi:hypothetical protein